MATFPSGVHFPERGIPVGQSDSLYAKATENIHIWPLATRLFVRVSYQSKSTRVINLRAAKSSNRLKE